MKKRLEKIWKKEEGFTLIELIIVIAILAIIAAVAIPNLISAIDNSRKTTDVTNARIIAEAAAIVIAKNDDLAGTDVTAATLSAGTGTFFTKLKAELGTSPLPKYKAKSGAQFSVGVDASTGVITVQALPDGSTGVTLYPTVDSTYANSK